MQRKLFTNFQSFHSLFTFCLWHNPSTKLRRNKKVKDKKMLRFLSGQRTRKSQIIYTSFIYWIGRLRSSLCDMQSNWRCCIPPCRFIVDILFIPGRNKALIIFLNRRYVSAAIVLSTVIPWFSRNDSRGWHRKNFPKSNIHSLALSKQALIVSSPGLL